MKRTVVMVLEGEFGVLIHVAYLSSPDPATACIEAYNTLDDSTLRLLDVMVFDGHQQDTVGSLLPVVKRSINP